jgi:hypothetical protein
VRCGLPDCCPTLRDALWPPRLLTPVSPLPCVLSARPQLNMSRWSGHFGTLTPFYRAWSSLKAPDRPLPEPGQLPVAAAGSSSTSPAAK